jgi:hypothetical protein
VALDFTVFAKLGVAMRLSRTRLAVVVIEGASHENRSCSFPVTTAILALGPFPPAQADGTRASAEQAVRGIYEELVPRCASRTEPSFQRLVWDSVTGQGGTGHIIDNKPGRGGRSKSCGTTPTGSRCQVLESARAARATGT